MRIFTYLPFLFVVNLLGCSSSTTTSPATAAKSDQELIAGSWTVTKVEIIGPLAKNNPLDKAQFIFVGDKISSPQMGGKEATYSLRPDVNPKEIDIVPPSGDEDPTRRITGIYKIESDTLIMCWATNITREQSDPNDPKKIFKREDVIGKRPTEFSTKDGAMVLTLTRERR